MKMSVKSERRERKRKGGRGPLPIEETAAGYDQAVVQYADGADPIPLIDLSTLPPRMLRNREVVSAWATSRAFESWLVHMVARHGIPMDSALLPVTLLTILVEATLVERAMHPELFERSDEGWDEQPGDGHVTESEAVEYGLYTPRKRPGVRRDPILPGCQGHLVTGTSCSNLRCYGDRFCPSCSDLYVRTERARRDP